LADPNDSIYRDLAGEHRTSNPGRRGQGPKPSPGLTVRGSAWILHSCIPQVLPGNTYGVLQGDARETRWLRTDARSGQVEMAAWCSDSCTSPTGRVCLPREVFASAEIGDVARRRDGRHGRCRAVVCRRFRPAGDGRGRRTGLSWTRLPGSDLVRPAGPAPGLVWILGSTSCPPGRCRSRPCP